MLDVKIVEMHYIFAWAQDLSFSAGPEIVRGVNWPHILHVSLKQATAAAAAATQTQAWKSKSQLIWSAMMANN